MNAPSLPERVIVFDGACNFCNSWTRFIIRRDPQARFRFAAMQSTAGSLLMTRNGIDPQNPATFLYVENGRGYTDTDAIFRVIAQLTGPWPLLRVLRVVPPFIRDPLYRFLARNRYRWFGRHGTCQVPEASIAERFIR
ncbi:MAG TPA: thiol-disulfide oxidoreductase DCC family protein [Solimonas sp.]|nr:thiol-disulfide oxidoreductase DCC family protein [Solimonas sp.]